MSSGLEPCDETGKSSHFPFEPVRRRAITGGQGAPADCSSHTNVKSHVGHIWRNKTFVWDLLSKGHVRVWSTKQNRRIIVFDIEKIVILLLIHLKAVNIN